MPTFPRLSLLLARLARVMAWALLVLGALLGVAWGCLHFWIVPRIGDYRPALERYAQQSIGVPVRIGQIKAESSGWAPSFELRDTLLLDPQGQPALRLPRVLIAISVRSVLSLKLEQLVFDAPELALSLSADGRWRFAGLDMAANARGHHAGADWLLSQREVIVRGGTLHWSREQATATAAPAVVSLRELDLVLRNSARHHDIRLDATPPADWGARFVTVGRFKRGLLSLHPGKWSDWSGQLYSYFPEVDVAQLSQHLPSGVPSGSVLSAGQGQLRLWNDVLLGRWAGGTADVQLSQVQTTGTAQAQPMALDSLSGRLSAQVSPLGFRLSTQNLAFVSAQGLVWPGGNVSLDYTHAQAKSLARGQLKANNLDLFALREVALRLPLPPTWREPLERQTVSGQVDSLQWQWQGPWQAPEQYDAKVALHSLSLPPPAGPALAGDGASLWPGLQGAKAKLNMTHKGGRLELSMGEGGALFLPGILEEAQVPVKALQASVVFQREGLQWRVPQWKLQLSNADLQGQWQGQWQPTAQGSGPGMLTLQGQLKQIDAARVHRYLPAALPKLRQYLQSALVKGVYTDVQVKLKGDLARWPFASAQDGEFRVAGRVRDLELDYVPPALLPAQSLAWPRLYKLNGNLVFERESMKLSEASARESDSSSGLTLSGGQAEIADLRHHSVLNVSADIKGLATDQLAWVQRSPLDRLMSGALAQAQATGLLQTRFKLSVPLAEPEKIKVQGAVMLEGNELRIAPATPLLEKLQGSVQFTETGFSLSGLQARMLGGPVRLDGGMRTAPSGASTEASGLQLRAQGQVSAEGLRAAPELSPLHLWAEHASGSAAYSAQLGWRLGRPELAVQSTLEGLALKLPAPLGKTAAASTPLSVRTQMLGTEAERREQSQFEWGSIASALYVRDLSGPEPVVLRGSLTLGLPSAQAPSLPASGVSANLALDRFSVDAWQSLLPSTSPSTSSAPSSTPSSAPPSAPPSAPSSLDKNRHPPSMAAWQAYLPTRFGLQANTLTADGRTLHAVTAGGVREGATWRVNVDARELNGHVQYRQPVGDQWGHLYARLSRLNLPSASVSEVESLLESPPVNLPSLDIVVDQLTLRGKDLGHVEVEAVNTEQPKGRVKTPPIWQLNKFNMTVPEATLRSTGRWVVAAEGGPARQTEMNFKLDVSDAGAFLTRLGTPEALRGGAGQLEGEVSWQGSPLSLHFPSMKGQFALKMGRGQFLKADAGAAKLLGVLSLQALPRRLLLDFRDVFYEGFAFDTVRGDVSIAQGIANTRNLQIKGVNAQVQIDGSADLAQESQKLRVVILPVIDAGTASLLAGIALNPVVGLTAYLAQLFLQNPLAKANTQEFLIDGSWADPKVSKVNDHGKAAAPTPTPAPAPAPSPGAGAGAGPSPARATP